MQRHRPLISVCFCAGMIGALGYSLLAAMLQQFGVLKLAGITLTFSLTPTEIYPRLIWGGVWGLAYFLTVAPSRARIHWIRKGLWLGLLPAAFQLFVLFPQAGDTYWAGIHYGQTTPLLIVALCVVWGGLTGLFSRLLWGP